MANSYNELFGLGSHSEDAALEGFWKLQDSDANTTVLDATSNSQDGTASANTITLQQTTGGPTNYLPGWFDFNGTSHRVSLPTTSFDAAETANAFTLAAWCNPDDVGADGTVVGQFAATDQFLLWLDVDGTGDGYAAAVRNSSGTGPLTGTNDNNATVAAWQFVTLTWDGTNLSPYVDTVAGTPASSSITLRSTSDNPYIGDDGSGARYWDGGMAGVSIWSRALTTGEMGQLYGGPEPTYTSGVSFSADGTYSVGTWDSQSNGTATYEVVAANAAGSVIDSASTSSGDLDLSAENGNTVYLLVRATNSGGYDIGDKATRTSAYGSSNDGYYELASVTASDGAGGGPSHASTMLLAGVGI